MRKLLAFTLFTLSTSLVTLKAQSGIISTVAGDAGVGYNGDNRQATTAELDQDGGVAVDVAGNIYIADYNNNRIRKVATTGIITTVAGNGVNGYSGNGGQATAAAISYPECVRVDSLGNIYFTEAGNALVRKVNTNGRISILAGIPGYGGFSGNGGAATAAELNNPVGLAIDKSLNVYVADQVNNQIRKISTSGIITAVAGKGPTAAGFSGNGAAATLAELDNPLGVAVDNDGNMYIADYLNNVVRKVNTSGIINAFAGNTIAGFNGFGGLPDTTELYNPTGVSVSATGNVYIADAGDGVVREVKASSGQMYVIAGIVDDNFSGDGGPATLAEINYPFDAVPDNNNNVYIADLGNNRIRKITAGCAGDSVFIGVFNYPECYGGTDGILEAFPTSNFEPFVYAWSNGNTTMKDSALPAATYTITVTDALGCAGTGSVVITQPTQIIVTTGSYTVCAGNQVTMSSGASGGAGAYTYTWITGAPTDTTTVLAIDSTTYTIYVNDGSGCYDSATAYVDVNPMPLVILNAQDYHACTSQTSDTLAGNPAGGTYSGPNLTGNIFDPSAAGSGTFNFTYTYTNPATGCSGTGTQSIIVSVCTGIDALTEANRIAVYPNPAGDQFTVQLQSGDAAQMITMYNVTGQQVYEHTLTPNENSQLSTINSQYLSNGVYFLKVLLQDGSTLVQKVDIVK